MALPINGIAPQTSLNSETGMFCLISYDFLLFDASFNASFFTRVQLVSIPLATIASICLTLGVGSALPMVVERIVVTSTAKELLYM